jgi:hypothetical protein
VAGIREPQVRKQDRLRKPVPQYWREGRQDTRARHQGRRCLVAARVEAEAVIQRWNDQLSRGRDMLWSPTIRAALVAAVVSRAIDLRTLDPGLGRHAGAGPTVLMVFGIGTDAEAARSVRPVANSWVRTAKGIAIASTGRVGV